MFSGSPRRGKASREAISAAKTAVGKHYVSRPASGGEGNRTPDLVNAIHALSQLSYAPRPARNR